MKTKTVAMGVALLLCSGFVFASEEHDHDEHEGLVMEYEDSMREHRDENESIAINVGNKICPVSGESIEGMGELIPLEYNGKIYNLCCKMCAKSFKKDPEKYIKIIEESMEEEVKESYGGQEHIGHHHE